MKRTGLALVVLFLAGGLVADPLFCCTLPAEDPGVRFAAPPMDCCSEEGTGACAPKLERAANVSRGPLVSTTSVLTADASLSVSPQVSPPGSTVSLACATVERPPRLHLLHSQLRI
jgi:hypothetical protein